MLLTSGGCAAAAGAHGRAALSLTLHKQQRRARSCPSSSIRASSRDGAPHVPAGGGEFTSEDGRKYSLVLGGEDFILSQRSGVEDPLFKGKVLGVDADIAMGGADIVEQRRTFEHLSEEFFVSPNFMDRFSLFIAKNYLGTKALRGRCPLILGVWGPSGSGKTFQVELCCKRLRIQPLVVSAGELEDEVAGEPGRRLRSRYIAAARAMQQTGVPSCLVIDDADAGFGKYEDTQRTVNSQIVAGTLMALCDDPHRVSVGGAWREDLDGFLPRVPIVLTATALSRLYAPLLRDGRMDKFFYKPDREGMVGVLRGIFSGEGGRDALPEADCRALLDAFPEQAADCGFFMGLKSRVLDSAVRDWILSCPPPSDERVASGERSGIAQAVEAAMREAAGSGRPASSPPVKLTSVPPMPLEVLLEAGARAQQEQRNVAGLTLSREYMRWQVNPEELERTAPPPPRATGEEMEAARRAAQEAAAQAEAVRAQTEAARAQAAAALAAANRAREEERAGMPPEELERLLAAERAASAASASSSAAASGKGKHKKSEGSDDEDSKGYGRVLDPKKVEEKLLAIDDGTLPWAWLAVPEAKALFDGKTHRLLDIRAAKDFDRAAVRGAVSVPALVRGGSSLAPTVTVNPQFQAAFAKAFPNPADVVVLGPTAGELGADEAFSALRDAMAAVWKVSTLADAGTGAGGVPRVVGVQGGFTAWDSLFTPTGVKRQRGSWAGKTEMAMWTASN